MNYMHALSVYATAGGAAATLGAVVPTADCDRCYCVGCFRVLLACFDVAFLMLVLPLFNVDVLCQEVYRNFGLEEV
jgi:hypothetical protein